MGIQIRRKKKNPESLLPDRQRPTKIELNLLRPINIFPLGLPPPNFFSPQLLKLMWHHQKQQRYIPPSSSSSSSLRTMEEVWKDITLNASSPITENATQQTYFHRQVPSGLTISHFRDFLPRTTGPISGSVQLAPPPPATILSLNSGTDSQFLKTIIPLKENHSSSSTSSTCSSSCSPSSALSVLCNNKKRCPPQQLRDPGSDDGRNKRMIKNRESAARSRARKQASSSPSLLISPFLSLRLLSVQCRLTPTSWKWKLVT